MDPTDLAAALERLAEQIADVPERPQDRYDRVVAALALRDALAAISTTVQDLDYDIARRLAEEGVVTKRCLRPECRRWMIVSPRGRRRRTCSDACRVAMTRSR